MEEHKKLYDFSEYPKDHFLFSAENKKVIGKFKDEAGSKPIMEFVGLRSKLYSYKVPEDDKVIESKKCKGVKKTTVKTKISFQDYYNSLMGEVKEDIQKQSTFNCIRSMTHELYSIQVNKIAIWIVRKRQHD